jgi:hypothetical protein
MALRDVAPRLWIWQLEHPDWTDESEWPPHVTSTCVESGGQIAVLDPLAPPADAEEIWTRFDTRALPFEHIIVSHGEPVHDRAAYERALELPPWG